jgi:membrane-bound ClpP family serine protease
MMVLHLAQAATQAATPTGDSSYLVWAGVLVGVAVALLVLELFVPSGGLLGVLCALAAIGSVVAFFAYDSTWGAVSLISYFVAGPMVLLFVMRLWSQSSFARRLVLGGDSEDLGLSVEEAAYASERARAERVAQLRGLIGAEGVTLSPLRPVGFIRIGSEKIDALAEGGVIDRNVPVVVVDIVDGQVRVRER